MAVEKLGGQCLVRGKWIPRRLRNQERQDPGSENPPSSNPSATRT